MKLVASPVNSALLVDQLSELRTIRGIALAALLLVSSLEAGQTNLQMSVTLDDLPVGPNRHTLEQQGAITGQLIATLTRYKVPAIGFVNESKLDSEERIDPERIALIEAWLDAGLMIGNHGHSHLSLHQVDPVTWMADVLKGEQVIRPLLEQRGLSLTWFRHPYLHAGRTPEIQRDSKDFLEQHGYRIAPVTIDNGEWIYADVYADAYNRGDDELMQRLGQDYVRYMLSVVTFYEDQSRLIEGELIPQILLLHANALNADWLDELLEALTGRGYQWIDMETATRHPAYQQPIDGYTGPAGITWLHRWAISRDLDRAIFRGEPEVPDWVGELRQ